jgi:hypothetical protein
MTAFSSHNEGAIFATLGPGGSAEPTVHTLSTVRPGATLPLGYNVYGPPSTEEAATLRLNSTVDFSDSLPDNLEWERHNVS